MKWLESAFHLLPWFLLGVAVSCIRIKNKGKEKP